MSQTDAIFAQTSDQLIFSASKVGRATATDLSWLSTYSYKKDRTQQSPLKGCWPGAQRDKKHRAQSVSVFLIFHPVSVLRMRPWGGLSGVDGGHKLFRQCELLLFFFFISCIFSSSSAVCRTYDYDAVDPASPSKSPTTTTLKILPN